MSSHSRVRVLVVLFLAVHAGFLFDGARRTSPTIDETAHLPAGISYWKFGRFDLYPVNPPLVKLCAAAPVVLADPRANWWSVTDAGAARPEWSVGRQLIAANGTRGFDYFLWARWACVPLVLLGGMICFLWARELFGVLSGVVALTLWCFCPNILGHGAIISTDVAAASTGVAAAYCFWRWLGHPYWASAVLAGAILGLAALTKFTWVLLFGLWPALWVVTRLRAHQAPTMTSDADVRRDADTPSGFQLVVMLVTGLFVVNAGYGFEETGKRLGDFQFVSQALGGPETTKGLLPIEANRFRGTLLGSLPVPVPRNYLRGIDLQKRDLESELIWNYLGGTYRQGDGWWYYYLYGLAVKVPLGTWVLLVLACLSRHVTHLGLRDRLVLLVPPLVVLGLVSSQTGMNQHVRYVYPVLPFAFVGISRVAEGWASRSLWWQAVTAAALGWSIVSSLSVYPQSFAYFNELAGGPAGGHRHLLGSSIDWGQDLFNLKRWLDEHPEVEPLHLAYAGNVDPRVAGIEFELPSTEPQSGWHAVSISLVCGEPKRVNLPDGKRRLVDPFAYHWFSQYEPIARAGYTVMIYYIEDTAGEASSDE